MWLVSPASSWPRHRGRGHHARPRRRPVDGAPARWRPVQPRGAEALEPAWRHRSGSAASTSRPAVDAGLLGRRARPAAVRRRRRSAGDQLQGQGAGAGQPRRLAAGTSTGSTATTSSATPTRAAPSSSPCCGGRTASCAPTPVRRCCPASTASTARSRRTASSDALLHGRAPRRPGQRADVWRSSTCHLMHGVVMAGCRSAGHPAALAALRSPAGRGRRRRRAAAGLRKGLRAGRLQLRLAPGRGPPPQALPIRSFGAIGFRSMWATENPRQGSRVPPAAG